MAGVLPNLHQQMARLQNAYDFIFHIGTMGADEYLCGLLRAGRFLTHGEDAWWGEQLLDNVAPSIPDQYWPSLTALIAGVRAHLLRADMVPLALRRLVTWIERFERRRLLAQAAIVGPSHAEAVVQAAVEAFLFQEGFFPIAQCSTVGKVDVVAFREQLDEAVKTGQLPLVLELKHSNRSRSTKRPGTTWSVEAWKARTKWMSREMLGPSSVDSARGPGRKWASMKMR